jgi:hypothetical protein
VAGRTGLEDVVKRLDKSTQEARMALAEVLRITRNVRDEVKVVNRMVESTSNNAKKYSVSMKMFQ